MIPILDWIFEGIVDWVASIVSQLMDAVSGLFLEALGTDMTAMEEYFPFVTKAYNVLQITAWTILALIVIWQLFRAFAGPITEAENPWHLVVRGAIFALLIGYAKPIFEICLSIARAPYTSLMELSMTGEDFTFAGIEQTLTNGLTTLVSAASVVGLILILIMEIALGWNYFKLLLETVERYVVVGVLCYTSPLAFAMGGSNATNNVFKSWCRMVGSQLLLLVLNVWFLRGFSSSVGQFIANGGALSTGNGSIFLWMFCALAYLRCAQRFDSYLSSLGLNVAQTGSNMAMELMMAARVITGTGGGSHSAGTVFGRNGSVATGTGAAASGFAAGFASKFTPNSYVHDAVVDGGARMGFGGGVGFVGRTIGGVAARNGATLSSDSISSVATRSPSTSGTIAGDIADRSLSNYMPHMQGFQLQNTQITGGHIITTATTPDGKTATVDMYNAGQYEKPDSPHSVVTASDGSQWYLMASGEGRGAFYDAPVFNGAPTDTAASSATPPDDDAIASSVSEEVPTIGAVPSGFVTDNTDGFDSEMPAFSIPGESSPPDGFVIASNDAMSDSTTLDTSGDVPSIRTESTDAPQSDGGQLSGAFVGDSGNDEHSYDASSHSTFSEAPLVAATFPDAPEGTTLRTVGEGMIEASSADGGNTLWYNSAFYQEPDAPHTTIQSANGVQWYAMQQQGNAPHFEAVEEAAAYNQATFRNFMPGYEQQISQVDGSHRQEGHFEVRNADGTGTAFYDTARYAQPRGDYQVYQDSKGSQWYAIRGEAAVERKPVFENGKPVYDGENIRTISVDTVRYRQTPVRFPEPEARKDIEHKPPRKKT